MSDCFENSRNRLMGASFSQHGLAEDSPRVNYTAPSRIAVIIKEVTMETRIQRGKNAMIGFVKGRMDAVSSPGFEKQLLELINK